MADIAFYEANAPEYARQVMTLPTVSIIYPVAVTLPGRIEFGSGDPSFGELTGGETLTSLVLYNNVANNDALSPIVCSYPCYYVCTGLYAADFLMASTGTIGVSTVC